MKNNESQELKAVYIQEASYTNDDEISLVDIAIILLRRKRMIAAIIASFIALSVITISLTPKKYTFSTSIEIGSQIIDGAVKPFETPQTLLAKVQHSFIPQAQDEHRKSNLGVKNKYNIKASSPKNSTIIILKTNGTEDQAVTITNLLQSVTLKATQDHMRIYDAVKQNLAALIEQAKSELTTLDSKKDKQNEIRQLLKGNIEVYKSRLINLRNTREIFPPMKSIEPTGTSRKLIIIIAAFTGVFLGVFSALFTEFLSKVKQKSGVGGKE